MLKKKIEKLFVPCRVCAHSAPGRRPSQPLAPLPICVKINEDEEPTRCYLVFYYTYDRLNMFRAALCLSSGAQDYTADYHMDRLILRLQMVGGFGAGRLASRKIKLIRAVGYLLLEQ
jgi:hypothetical protein